MMILDEQQEKHFIILLDEMAEQDLISRPLPEVIVPKDDGLYRIMKRLERKSTLALFLTNSLD